MARAIASRVQRAWDREIGGRLLDHGMRGVDPLRATLLREVRGRVVEIGFGTGANLPFYPVGVRQIVAVEPSEGLAARARPRLEAWARDHPDGSADHQLVLASATRALPLDAASFDAAVITFVLCSVRDARAVLAETARLLRPGAPLYLAEHVAAAGGTLLACQRAIRPVWKAVVGGCDPARDTRARIEREGWDTRELRDVHLELPFPVWPGLVGIARAPV